MKNNYVPKYKVGNIVYCFETDNFDAEEYSTDSLIFELKIIGTLFVQRFMTEESLIYVCDIFHEGEFSEYSKCFKSDSMLYSTRDEAVKSAIKYFSMQKDEIEKMIKKCV